MTTKLRNLTVPYVGSWRDLTCSPVWALPTGCATRCRRITEIVLHPRPATAAAAIRWNEVAGRQLRRSWMAHWRQQTVTLATLPASVSPPTRPPRAARCHRRLSWLERLGRNARAPLLVTSIQVTGVAEGPGSPPALLVRRDDGPHSFLRCFVAWVQSPCAVCARISRRVGTSRLPGTSSACLADGRGSRTCSRTKPAATSVLR